ncbi:succinate dehydrogenase, cytochrome b556 subunit [Sulfuriflexus sp.]|uniref:succinate dehydrogenase, cytochrome b556 subunit n=1 Tax=Sulfuriflexus sp. TaxID=2015443 RepID=UPI0028CBEF85|nr:succinate dehydrogenase, cytochrome b556 subunit [Sulfuriflexus sp.]MDT8402945.1 succinate dehydrogenase, cytochrome b556 subunit [Sulfuriflexus sp.]
MSRRTPPVFLNLLQIRMPVTAIASILHRLSGILLFLSLPFLILALQQSLQSPEGFARLMGQLDALPIKALLVILLWGLFQHLFAGLRFLLLDVEVGIKRQQACYSAWLVNILAVIATIILVGGCL